MNTGNQYPASGEVAQAVNACVSCGSCQGVCPAYKAGRQEGLVARGKIKLLKGYAQGWLPGDRDLLMSLSRCLLCGRCTKNCANKVHSMEALRECREILADKAGAPFLKRLILEDVLTRPNRLDNLARAGRIGQALLKGVVNTASGLNLSLTGLEGLEKLPPVATRPWLSQAPVTISGPKGAPTVAFFVGCMANYLRPALAGRAISLLSRRFNVLIPPGQGCCGLPAISAGMKRAAVDLARLNLEALSQVKADLIVTTCGSCAYALASELVRLAPDEHRQAAEALASKVREISQVLALEKGILKPAQPSFGPVAVHDPCHLKTGMGVSQEPRSMLEAAGIELVEMAGADACCGGGGLLPANDPELSRDIFLPRVEALAKSGAICLATSCSGCFAQWRRGLDMDTGVVHPVELLDSAC